MLFYTWQRCRVLVAIVVLMCYLPLGENCLFLDVGGPSDKELYTFCNTLRQLNEKPSDIVFLLDESGSIGIQNFPYELKFTEMIARMFSIAPDHTRVAVITFGTGNKFRFNYIPDDSNGNMCTFMKELNNIDYSGGWTWTKEALEGARELLKTARYFSQKIVVLITDGVHTTADPVPVAEDLKNEGVIILSVGIADINKEEVYKVATSPEHVYMLEDFKENIQKINEDMRTDVRNFHWAAAEDTSQCSSGCDENANCFCGANSGEYQCVCKPGYFGLGDKGQCQPCPKNTYKEVDHAPQCTPCPENSITSDVGSRSESDCKCKEGYKQDSSNNCRVINCPKLIAPSDGRLFECPTSTVGSSCSFKCNEKFCPEDSFSENGCRTKDRTALRPRVCLPSGQWSGSEFNCKEIQCSQSGLLVEHGFYRCSEAEYLPRTQCELRCVEGFKPSKLSTRYRTCQHNGTWTGDKGICETVTCKPLKTNAKFYVKPEECAELQQPFGAVCQHFCKPGFKLDRLSSSSSVALNIGERRCSINGDWAGKSERITCRDVTPPTVVCPPSQTVTTDKGLALSAFVNWPQPEVSDNSNKTITPKLEYPLRKKHQPKIKQPYRFPIGKNKLVYKATDGAKRTSSCTFFITVVDNEPPSLKCPKRVEKYAPEGSTDITWRTKFHDNSEKTEIALQTHNPGDRFSWGAPVEVIYEIKDPSGNTANCSFNVIAKPYECRYYNPPANGAIVCANTTENSVACTVSCNEGYDFSRTPAAVYECLNENGEFFWEPQLVLPGTQEKLKPWPDCSAKSGQVVNAGLQLQYFTGDCQNETTIAQLKEKFQAMLQEQLKHQTCTDPSKCKVTKFSISCKAQRQKRSVNEEDNETFVILVNFEIEISEETLKDIQEAASNSTEKQEINDFLTTFVDDIASSNPDEENIILDAVTVIKNATVTCQEGQVNRDGSCINCPHGTFLNISTSRCEFCPVNTYQENEASTNCIPCSNGTFTIGIGSISKLECTELCRAGTFSDVALEPCTPCDFGYYQDLPGQTECKECPINTTTWTVGASDIANCTVPCKSGHASPSGYEPCYSCPEGSYQPDSGQTECIPCPGELLTAIEGREDISSCEKITVCDSSPCLNGGNCTVLTIDDYECSCPDGYEGINCEINEDDCDGDLCFNNGTCVDGINDYICECTTGFTGRQCETNIDDCYEDACLNGGTCLDDTDSYHCVCQQGYTGQRCEININECASNPCQNGGFCFDMENAFRCSCVSGFTGPSCEVDINECDPNLCLNNGTCFDEVGRYSCNCSTGFSGKNCEIMADNCESHPCQNSGICVNLPNDYTCQCLPGFKGRNCNEEAPPSYDLVFDGSHSSDYALMNVDRDLFAVTISFWMKTTDTKNRGTPVSYAYKSPLSDVEVDNGLTFMDYSKFIIYLHGKEIRTDLVANRDSKWHHYALTWESTLGSWAIYEDGKMYKNGLNISVGEPLWKGTFILGQEQDSVGGSFSATESFNGRITQFNVWNYELSADDIKEISTACGYVGNIINWPSVKENLHGEVKPQAASEVCSESCHEKKENCLCQYSSPELRKRCGFILTTSPNCENNQSSVEIGKDQYICDCAIGLEGKFCEYDIDECLTNNGGCSHTCNNTVGSFECTCPDDMILMDDNRTCQQSTYCDHNGLIYNDTETWTEKCKTCYCEKGQVTCEQEKCPKIACRKLNNGTQPILLPGKCCKSCESLPENVCSLSPSNTYTTFTGKQFNFASTCRYILAHDCNKGTFSVHVQNEALRLRRKILTVYNFGTQITVTSNGKLLVDGKQEEIPYRDNDDITVAYSKPFRSKHGKREFIRITTKQGLSILWTSQGLVTINVPSTLNDSLCGLCEALPYSFYTMRNGFPTKYLSKYLRSWRVDENCEKPEYKVPGSPKLKVEGACKQASYALQKIARRTCDVLRREVFHQCYQEINVQEYYDMCLQDACMCAVKDTNGVKDPCPCGSILTYVLECEKKGFNITLNGNDNFCDNFCQNGTEFQLDAPTCPATCSGTEENNPHCQIESKIPKCSCPDPKVFHEGQCIDKTECPVENDIFRNESIAEINISEETSASNESSVELNLY